MTLEFDPQDPFPLVSEASHSHEDAQKHAAQVDAHLGFNIEEIEDRITESSFEKNSPEGEAGRRRHWIGLPPKSLLTPYVEIRRMFHKLNLSSGARVIDLGAGYGRMGFVIGAHYPDVFFLGYECVRERVTEGARCLALKNYQNVQMQQQDLSLAGFVPAVADFYFIYDFGDRPAIEKTLSDLKNLSQKNSFTVIGRGRASRDLIERGQPWLSQVVAPIHGKHYSFYRNR